MVPDAVERRERQLREFKPESGEDMPRSLKEVDDLRAIPYREIVDLCRYLSGHSPFETKHGVKGAEFENVLVVVGRGWNRYNFNQMLELAANLPSIPANRQDAFERNRNLFLRLLLQGEEALSRPLYATAFRSCPADG